MSSKIGKQKETGDLKPKLRFSEFQSSPKWKEKKIKEILVESCLPGSKGDEAKKITVKLWGKGVFEKEETIIGSANTQYYKRKAGQFIYSKLDFLNQAFGIIPSRLDEFESTADLPCFDLRGEINPIFLLEYVKREAFYKKFGEIADGGRKAKRIQVETFLSFPIQIPPLYAEQQKIADCFSSIDDIVYAQTQKLDHLREHKKWLLKRLFPQDGETLPNIRFPEFQNGAEWKRKQLRQVAQSITNKAPAKANDAVLTLSTEFGLVMQGEYFGKKIAGEDVSRYTKIVYNDFVYNDRATKLSAYGTIKKLTQHQSGVVSPIYKCFRFREEECPVFWEFYFESGAHDHELSKLANEGARGGRFNISIANFLSTYAMYPEIVEQQKIAGCLSFLDELISKQAKSVDGLKAHKNGLMQQLFPTLEEVKE